MAFKKKGAKPKKEKPNKMGAIKTVVDDITFASQMEADYYQFLKEEVKAGRVLRFEMQVQYLLQEGFTKYDRKIRPINYVSDFDVWYADGSFKVIDVKGKETKDFMLKRKMFDFRYPELTLQLVKIKDRKLMLKPEGWVDFDEDKKAKARSRREAKKKSAGTTKTKSKNKAS
jgi:hypothetical protein